MRQFVFRTSLAAWMFVTFFYATSVLFAFMLYMKSQSAPLVGWVALLSEAALGNMAALLLWLTRLPVPLLLVFGGGSGQLSNHLQLYGPYPIWGYLIVLVGLVSVSLSAIALVNIRSEHAWSWVFIGLSVCAYSLSIVEAVTGVCTSISRNFDGLYAYCQLGFLATFPTFCASSVLMVTAIAIHRYVRDEPISAISGSVAQRWKADET